MGYPQPLFYLFSSPLVLVESRKVVSDDRDGQGDDEDPADGAARADHLAETSHRTDVTVTDLLTKII